MIKLTDTEYLPELADGYRWNISLTVNGQVRVALDAHDFYGNYSDTIRSKTFSPPGEATAAVVRSMVLRNAEFMVGKFSPWNPEAQKMIWEVTESLHPPQDDAEPTPRSDVFI